MAPESSRGHFRGILTTKFLHVFFFIGFFLSPNSYLPPSVFSDAIQVRVGLWPSWTGSESLFPCASFFLFSLPVHPTHSPGNCLPRIPSFWDLTTTLLVERRQLAGVGLGCDSFSWYRHVFFRYRDVSIFFSASTPSSTPIYRMSRPTKGTHS